MSMCRLRPGAAPVLVLAFACGSATGAWAQTLPTSLTGTVTDASGGAVRSARVIATSVRTGVEYRAVTNDAGRYVIAPIAIGRYVVKVEAESFKPIATQPVDIESGQQARLDLQLEVGAVTETLVVTSRPPILQTESAVVGTVVTAETIEALPLNGHNFNQLTLMIPGSITNAPEQFAAAKNTVGAFGRPNVNGQRAQGNSYTLDGVDMNESMDNLLPYQPSPDALAEVRVETNNYSAEFGNVTGAVVSSTLKSGTNQWSGSLFEFLRDDAFDANTWANNRSGADKAELKQHVFGGTIGGPLVRNRVFFFGDYQGTLIDTPGGAATSVAPAAWRRGDFSSLLGQVTIVDPVTGQPFPGNVIPEGRISPIARAIVNDHSLYPLPNTSNTVAQGNLVGRANGLTRNHQFDVKLDGRATDDDSVFLRFSYGSYRQTGDQAVMPLLAIVDTRAPTRNAALGWTRTLSSTAVNELLLGYNDVTYTQEDFDWSGLGRLNNRVGIPGDQARPSLSAINVAVGLSPGFGNAAVNSDNIGRTFQVSEKLAVLRGRHYLKVGGTLLHHRMKRYYAGNEGANGHFDFTGAFTGLGFADFLLDQVASKGLGSSSPAWEQRQNRIGVFVQDDFKVKRNLTLNLGLRWAFTSPLVEVNDRQVNFDPETGRELRAGVGGASRALYEPYYRGFEPRLGFAWSPAERWVLRGGYGITQHMEGAGANLRLPQNPPFSAEHTATYDRATGAGTMARGFTDLRPSGDTPAGHIKIYDPELRPQFTQQWNLFVELQLDDSTSASVGYVGHHATHLITPYNFNQPLPGTGPPETWAPLQQRRPLYPFLPEVTDVQGTASRGRSDYDALQVSVRKRARNGLEFLAGYTYGKAMSDNIGYYGGGWAAASHQGFYNMDATDLSRDYGPSFFDARHTLVLSGHYELPWGKGRSRGSQWSGLTNAVLGGWEIASVFQAHTGFPITVIDSHDNSLRGLGPLGNFNRPDLVGNPVPSGQGNDRWIDIGAFRRTALGTFGDSPVGVIRGPGYWNWDLALSKRFRLDDRRSVAFRVQAYNVLNHTNFWMLQHAGPDFADPTTFGQLNTTVGQQRILEFALKLHF